MAFAFFEFGFAPAPVLLLTCVAGPGEQALVAPNPAGRMRSTEREIVGMRALALTEANFIIAECFKKAAELGSRPLTIAVLDAGGRVKSAQKQDGCALLRFEIAYGKAFASLAMGRSSRMVLQKAKDKPDFIEGLKELANGPLFLEGGGQLIRDKNGEVMGSIGITGDTNELDDECAIAGIRAAGLCVDEDFEEGGGAMNVKLTY